MFEDAVKAKKADASKKDFFVNSTMTSTELKDLFGAITVPYTPVFNASTATTVGASGNGEDRSKWTFKDWSQKDPKGLAEMRNDAPHDFENLVKGLPSQLSVNYDPTNDKKF